MHVRLLRRGLILFLIFVGHPLVKAEPPPGRNYALLIGVRSYYKEELRPLRYPENDVNHLAEILKKQGYRRVVVMTATDGANNPERLPTAQNIRDQLTSLLEDRKKDDLVLVAFSGHGVQFKGERAHYFCPMDARLGDKQTLVSLSEVYDQLKACPAGRKLMFVDACRDDPEAPGSKFVARIEREARPQEENVPASVAAVFSCSRGQYSYESEELKRGVFFHFLIEGLKGKAARNREVGLLDLVHYVQGEVPDYVKEHVGARARQLPQLVSEVSVPISLTRLDDRPDPNAEVERDHVPRWTHGMSMKVRAADRTLSFGAEAFLDRKLERLTYITETGALGVGPVGKPAGAKAPAHLYDMTLKARAPGTTGWDGARRFGVEVYKDENAGVLLYLSETGSLAVVPAGRATRPDKPREPVWSHAMDLKVRRAGEKDFTRTTRVVSVEVYRDENTDHFIYLTDQGQIAVVPARDQRKTDPARPPTWLHAFDVKCRRAAEQDFGPDTKKYGLEVYRDENVATLLYLSETGAVAAVPNVALKALETPDPVFVRGLALKARKADEQDFTRDTRTYGIEVFRDPKTDLQFWLGETGAIAVAPSK
jgi:hypothetical protein